MNKVNFAAIDIGSNAVRLLVKSIEKNPITGESCLGEALLVRFPLRLGDDVFRYGNILKTKEKQLILLMSSFKQMMSIFGIDSYRACATSAMREAKNGKDITKKIHEKTKLKVEIIDGEEEARIIYDTHTENLLNPKNDYLYVDVGGGSTQITLINAGALVYSHSFNIGTVRMLNEKLDNEERKKFSLALSKLAEQYPNLNVIGSGGNINKLLKLADTPKNSNEITLKELEIINKSLQPLTVEERMIKYKLKKDRAEVIVYAANLFIEVAAQTKTQKIIVPNISISDGIIEKLYEKHEKKNMKKKI